MTQQPTPAPAESVVNRTVPWLLCVLLIDGACIIGLTGVRTKLPTALFLIALIAGIGLFAIRLHNDASWWTGHWGYSLSRR